MGQRAAHYGLDVQTYRGREIKMQLGGVPASGSFRNDTAGELEGPAVSNQAVSL